MKRTIVISFLLLAILTSGTAQQVAIDRPLSNRIEQLVAPHVKAELLSGVILIARGNNIIFQNAYGSANWELRSPNTLSTRFGIASVTKPMTEILVNALVKAGKINLETPVEQYLPGFPRGPEGGAPTINHLLTHRAGVPHRVTTEIDETQILLPADIVERVKKAGLLFEPGSKEQYSSAGFTCLARIIEIVENKPYEQVIAERLFNPAGMNSATNETGQNLMARRASPYRLGANSKNIVVKNTPYKDLRFLTGAGSVYATAEDLLHLILAMRNGVFGPTLWDETFDNDATTWRGWTGRTNGYEASVDVLPAQNLIFIFLSNLQSATNWQTREKIRNILLGQDVDPIPLPPPVVQPFEQPKSLVGTFGAAEIMLINGALFRGDNEFYPTEGKRYYIPASGSMMRFRRNSTGAVDALINIRGDRESALPKSSGH